MSSCALTRVRRTTLYTSSNTAATSSSSSSRITAAALWPVQRVRDGDNVDNNKDGTADVALSSSPPPPPPRLRTLACTPDVGVMADGAVRAVCLCAGEVLHCVLYMASDDGAVCALRCVAQVRSGDNDDDDGEVHVVVVEQLARVVLRTRATTSSSSSEDVRDRGVQLVLAPAPSRVFACVDGGVCALDALTLRHIPDYFVGNTDDGDNDEDDEGRDVMRRMLALHRVTLCCLGAEQQQPPARTRSSTSSSSSSSSSAEATVTRTCATRLALLLEPLASTATEATRPTSVLLLDCSSSTRARLLYRTSRTAPLSVAPRTRNTHTVNDKDDEDKTSACTGDDEAAAAAAARCRLLARAQRTPCVLAVLAGTTTMAWRRHTLLVGARTQYCLYDVRNGQVLSRLDTMVAPLGGVLARYFARCHVQHSPRVVTADDDDSDSSDDDSSQASDVSASEEDDDAAAAAAATAWPAGLLFRTGAEKLWLYSGNGSAADARGATSRRSGSSRDAALATATPLAQHKGAREHAQQQQQPQHDVWTSSSDHLCDAQCLPPYVLGLNARNEVVCVHTDFDKSEDEEDDVDSNVNDSNGGSDVVGGAAASSASLPVCVTAASFARAVVTPLGLLVHDDYTVVLLSPDPVRVQLRRRVACGAYTAALRCLRDMLRATQQRQPRDEGDGEEATRGDGGKRDTTATHAQLRQLYRQCGEHALQRCATLHKTTTTSATAVTTGALARRAFDYLARAHVPVVALLQYFPELLRLVPPPSPPSSTAPLPRLTYRTSAPYRQLYRILHTYFVHLHDDSDVDNTTTTTTSALSVVALALFALFVMDATRRVRVRATRDDRDAFFVQLCRLQTRSRLATATSVDEATSVNDDSKSSSAMTATVSRPPLLPTDTCLSYMRAASGADDGDATAAVAAADTLRDDDDDTSANVHDAAPSQQQQQQQPSSSSLLLLVPLLLASSGRYDAALRRCRRTGAVHEAAVVLRMRGERANNSAVTSPRHDVEASADSSHHRHHQQQQQQQLHDDGDGGREACDALYTRHLPWMLCRDRGTTLRVLVTTQPAPPSPLCVVPLLIGDAEALYHYLHFVLSQHQHHNDEDDKNEADDAHAERNPGDTNNNNSSSSGVRDDKQWRALYTLHACNMADMIHSAHKLITSHANTSAAAAAAAHATRVHRRRDDDATAVGVLATLRRALCRFLRRAYGRYDTDAVLLRLRHASLYTEQLTLLRCAGAHAQALALLVYTLDDVPRALRYCAEEHAARLRAAVVTATTTATSDNNDDDVDRDIGTRPLQLPRAATTAAIYAAMQELQESHKVALCKGVTRDTNDDNVDDADAVATWTASRLRSLHVNAHLHLLLHTLLHPPAAPHNTTKTTTAAEAHDDGSSSSDGDADDSNSHRREHAARIDDALWLLNESSYADMLDAHVVLHALPDTLPLYRIAPYVQRAYRQAAGNAQLAHVECAAACAARAAAVRLRTRLQQRCVVVTARSGDEYVDDDNDTATRCARCRRVLTGADTALCAYPNLTLTHVRCHTRSSGGGGAEVSAGDGAAMALSHCDPERGVPFRAAL